MSSESLNPSARSVQRRAVDGVLPPRTRTKTQSARIRRRPAHGTAARKRFDEFAPAEAVTSAKKIVNKSGPKSSAASVATHKPLPGAEELIAKVQKSSHSKSGKARLHLTKRHFHYWLIRSSLAVVVVVLLTGGLIAAKGYFQLKHVFKGGSAPVAALKPSVSPDLLKGEGDGRVNILLLGIGGPDHAGGDLTDTIMVASIDPVNNKATLLSIPRDLWVKMPTNFVGNYQKVNAAYESGKYGSIKKQDITNVDRGAVVAGLHAADDTISQIIGAPIHYNVLVNFEAFKQAVDTVGGVSVNVPADLYDPTMAWENDHSAILAKAGAQNFDGRHALIYVRSRETSSDFARGQRQRSVMVALKDKTLTAGTLANPAKLSSLLSAFGDNIQSDISLGDTTRLLGIMKKINNTDITSVGLADEPTSLVTTGNQNGISIVRPKAGLFDYGAIQTFVRGQFKDGYIAKENARVAILNGSTNPGAETALATTLKTYGYNVVSTGAATATNYQQTTVVDLTHGKDKYTQNYLEKRFSTKAVTSAPDKSIQPNAADFVIIIGQNETPSSQT